jgi:hypothetical protein
MARKLSPTLPACVAMLIAACATLPPAEGNLGRRETAELARLEAALRDSPQRICDPALEAWLADMLLRIDPEHGSDISLYLLDSPTLQADLVGERVLRVRLGLLLALINDGELTFVLAHELAHRSLGHVQARRGPHWDAQAAENAADRMAIDALARHGYAPSTASALLRRMLLQTSAKDARTQLHRRIDAIGALPSQGNSLPSPTPDPRFDALLLRYRDRADRGPELTPGRPGPAFRSSAPGVNSSVRTAARSRR